MRHHKHNQKSDFISGYYLEDTSICDKLIELFNFSPYRQSAGSVGKTNQIIKEWKESTDISVPPNDPVLYEYIDQHLQLCLEEYCKQYEYANMVEPYGIFSKTNIQRYLPNQGYFKYHMEINGAPKTVYRHLVYMTYLNDVTDGGETEWFYQKTKIKPEKGLTVIWPAAWTHTHRGVTSPTQEKFIATGWYEFDKGHER